MKSSSRLQSLVDALSQPVICHEADGTLGAMNASAERLLQCRSSDVLGRVWTEGPWSTVDGDERAVGEHQLPGRRALAAGEGVGDTLLGIRPRPTDAIVWVNARSVLVPGVGNDEGAVAVVLLEPTGVPVNSSAGVAVDPRGHIGTDDKHRALFEQSMSIMLIIHPSSGQILDANQAACEFYGYPRETLVQMSILDINTLSEERVRTEMDLARTRNTGRFRFRHRLASGELRDVEVFSSPVPLAGTEVLHSIIFDVTKRESATRQIQEHVWQLGLINAAITAAVQGATASELLQTVCEALRNHTQVEEVVAVLLEPGAGARVAAGSVDAVVSGRVRAPLHADTLEVLRAAVVDGHPMNCEDDTAPLFRSVASAFISSPPCMLLLPLVGESEPFGALLFAAKNPQTLRDVARRSVGLEVQVARALEIARIVETRRRLLAAIEQTSDMIIITEVDGKVVYANPAFISATSRALEWTLGRPLPEVVGAPTLQDAWQQVSSGRRWAGSFSIARVDGSRLDADAVISPVRSDTGEVVNILAVVRDVTRELQLQLQMQRAQKMEGIGRLAGGLAHDFNNTLAAVMGYAGLVRARLSPDHPAISDVLEIQETIVRASNLSRQLLTFARRQVTEPQPIDLNTLILNLDRMLRRLIGEDIELVTAPSSSLKSTVAEVGQLEQVIVNLVVNARDAMPDGGKIVVETENVFLDVESVAGYDAEPGDYVHLSIRDTGVGMTEEVKQHIFEPFFTTKSPDKGTGLGLATCFGIVGQCGGYIEIESQVGRGTTVHIYLPATSADRSAPPSERVPIDLPRGNETVLIAEDDPVVRRAVVRLLNKHGYRVIEASNGEEALRAAEREEGPIQVLLTDVIMPRMGARELIDEFKKLRPDIKVLLMSGYADDKQLRQTAGAQQIPFLEKPFTEHMLVHKLRLLLDR